jgi:2-polyprenyl-6-methoxyphenol hydroxylase-like FAD-dependent oxidoreductase
VLDPVSAHGITNALRDAELLAGAIVDGWSGRGEPGGGRDGLGAALAVYHRQRDAAAHPMFELTARTARLDPVSRAERLLYGSLAGRPAEISRFFGALSGTEPLGPYLGLGNMARVIAGRPWPFGVRASHASTSPLT